MIRPKPDKAILSKNHPKPISSKSLKQIPKSEKNETNYSLKSPITVPNPQNIEEIPMVGESVKVALRIRPMNGMESGRGDQNCVKVINEQACHILIK